MGWRVRSSLQVPRGWPAAYRLAGAFVKLGTCRSGRHMPLDSYPDFGDLELALANLRDRSNYLALFLRTAVHHDVVHIMINPLG
jgi:hypothetical protein